MTDRGDLIRLLETNLANGHPDIENLADQILALEAARVPARYIHELNENDRALLPAVIARKTRQDGDCIVWTGALNTQGYGVVRIQDGATRRSTGAHRAAWLLAHGSVPPGLVIDHLCRNRACVNVAHLEPVTAKENVARGLTVTRPRVPRTECRRGHALTEENVYIYDYRKTGVMYRGCRECRRITKQARS